VTNELTKPLLLVDIDGVISLYGFEWDKRPPGTWLTVDGQPHLISATAGAHLRELTTCYELAWCSGWEEKANEYLPLALGLPAPLPFLTFERKPAGGRPHWKLPAIEAYAGQTRALAWIDDAHDDESRAWAERRPGPTYLVDTEPPSGMTSAHVRALQDWIGGAKPR
jgi:hypothetical protein